jgi:hypothetical protein
LNIKILSQEEIDCKTWDQCIDSSLNGTVFGHSWYLNLVCENWGALVLDNYETVMPLPLGSMLNNPAVISPCLAPQLGVFSPRLPAPEIIDAFLSLLRSRFRYIRIGLNKYNLISDEEFKIKTARSYSLDLIQSHSKLCQAYSRGTKQTIENGLSNKVTVMNGVPFQEFIRFYQTLCMGSPRTDNQAFFNTLRRVLSFSILHRLGELYGAYSAENNLTAAAFVIRTSQRITLLISAIQYDPSAISAFSVLLDHLLKQYAEKKLTIDFEILPCPGRCLPTGKSSSDKMDLMRLFDTVYTGFGAKIFNYPIILFNELPWYSKLIEKLQHMTSNTTGSITI